MSVVTEAATGAEFALWAGTAGLAGAGPGHTLVVGSLDIAPGLGGRNAVRLTTGHLKVTGVPNFTDTDSTIEAWVRIPLGYTSRIIFTRLNGSTEVSLTVDADGRPNVAVASTAGPYRVTLHSPVRIDDGQWHQMAVVIKRGQASVVNVSLVVDGTVVASGQMNPGLFGAAPQLGMTTDVHIGGRGVNSGRMRGDLLVVAVRSQAVAVSTLAARWASRPMGSAATTGWGIILG